MLANKMFPAFVKHACILVAEAVCKLFRTDLIEMASLIKRWRLFANVCTWKCQVAGFASGFVVQCSKGKRLVVLQRSIVKFIKLVVNLSTLFAIGSANLVTKDCHFHQAKNNDSIMSLCSWQETYWNNSTDYHQIRGCNRFLTFYEIIWIMGNSVGSRAFIQVHQWWILSTFWKTWLKWNRMAYERTPGLPPPLTAAKMSCWCCHFPCMGAIKGPKMLLQ